MPLLVHCNPPRCVANETRVISQDHREEEWTRLLLLSTTALVLDMAKVSLLQYMHQSLSCLGSNSGTLGQHTATTVGTQNNKISSSVHESVFQVGGVIGVALPNIIITILLKGGMELGSTATESKNGRSGRTVQVVFAAMLSYLFGNVEPGASGGSNDEYGVGWCHCIKFFVATRRYDY